MLCYRLLSSPFRYPLACILAHAVIQMYNSRRFQLDQWQLQISNCNESHCAESDVGKWHSEAFKNHTYACVCDYMHTYIQILRTYIPHICMYSCAPLSLAWVWIKSRRQITLSDVTNKLRSSGWIMMMSHWDKLEHTYITMHTMTTNSWESIIEEREACKKETTYFYEI